MFYTIDFINMKNVYDHIRDWLDYSACKSSVYDIIWEPYKHTLIDGITQSLEAEFELKPFEIGQINFQALYELFFAKDVIFVIYDGIIRVNYYQFYEV